MVSPTHKNCPSEYCGHKGEHEHSTLCEPVDERGVKIACRFDPTCRCVDALEGHLLNILVTYPAPSEEAMAREIVKYLKERGIYA